MRQTCIILASDPCRRDPLGRPLTSGCLMDRSRPLKITSRPPDSMHKFMHAEHWRQGVEILAYFTVTTNQRTRVHEKTLSCRQRRHRRSFRPAEGLNALKNAPKKSLPLQHPFLS